MPTTKKRINVTISDSVDEMLEYIADRDGVPVATKASELLTSALQLEEDQVWDALASRRDFKKASFVSHIEAWV